MESLLFLEHLFLLFDGVLKVLFDFVDIFRVVFFCFDGTLVLSLKSFVIMFELFDLLLKKLNNLWRQFSKVSFLFVSWPTHVVFLLHTIFLLVIVVVIFISWHRSPPYPAVVDHFPTRTMICLNPYIAAVIISQTIRIVFSGIEHTFPILLSEPKEFLL